MNRPSWTTYFLDLASLAATRSTCLRRRVGAVIVRDNQVLATGYNGAPSGLAHCSETGCLRERLGVPSGQRHELCRAAHAEQNAIVQAARNGVAINGAELYCTTAPCSVCARMLVNAGIRRITYVDGYPDELAKDILEEAGVVLVRGNVVDGA